MTQFLIGVSIGMCIAGTLIRGRNYYSIHRLLKLATAACKHIDKYGIEGAKLYTGLSCVDVSKCQNTDSEVYYVVVIEEASPDAYELCVAIQDFIRDAGFKGAVEVRTEW